MRTQTRFYPTVGALESRELLSSLSVVARATEVHVEKGTGQGRRGTLEGTATFLPPDFFFPTGQVELTSGTGNVKPFGRVRIFESATMPSILPTLIVAAADEPGSSILLANAKGHVVADLYLANPGDTNVQRSQYMFYLSKSVQQYYNPSPPSHAVGRGILTVSFPQGSPDGNHPTVPLTITF